MKHIELHGYIGRRKRKRKNQQNTPPQEAGPDTGSRESVMNLLRAVHHSTPLHSEGT
jgi:hypothetical protein